MKVNGDPTVILLDFAEGTTVTLDSVELDGNEVANDFQQPDSNRFTYWPESWNQAITKSRSWRPTPLATKCHSTSS